MWFLGKSRGTELTTKAAALSGFTGTKDTLLQLYGILSILDSKATGLLTVDAFLIAALVGITASRQEIIQQFGLSVPADVLELQLASMAVSAFLCLLVIRVTWRFMHYVPDAPQTTADFDLEIRRLANSIDDRTHYYWLAWLLALIGFVLTLAWWEWWYALIGFVAIFLFAWGRG
jgi:hypothetical protein